MEDSKILGYKVVEFSDIAEEDYIPGLINDYWCFDEKKQNTYTYTIKNLLEKYEINYQGRLETLLRKNGCLQVKIRLDCNKCTSEIKINTRKDFTSLKNSRYLYRANGFCKDCHAIEVKSNLIVRLLDIQYRLETLESKTAQPNESSLSYLEKIFLFSLINYEELGSQDTYLRAWSNFSEHEACGAESIMQNLISKGFIIAIHNADEIEEDTRNAQVLLNNSSHILDDDFIVSYKTSLKKIILPKPEIFIPDNYQSPSKFSLKLLNDIKTSTLSSNDITQITEYVTSKRINELEGLYYYICSQNKIPSCNTAKKILVFKKIAENFNLLEAMNIISYQATLMQAALYDKLRMNSNAHNANIFIKNIEGRIDRLIENTNITEYYTKKLPENWETTQTEVIISLEILELLDTWEKFTTKQILHTWFNKVSIE